MSTISEEVCSRPQAVRPSPSPCAAGRIALRRAIGVAAIALLAACGGGGGDSGGGVATIAEPQAPPTTGAALASSTAEAAEAAKAAAAAADRVAERASLMNGLAAAVGGTATGSSAPPSDRKRALAVTTDPCTDWVDAPCSGTVVLDTNVDVNATLVRPGDYGDFTFNDVRGRLGTSSVGFSGRMRLEFETTLDLNAANLNGLSLRFRFDAFSATLNGVTYGPVSENGRLQVDSAGRSTFTANGARYSALSGVSITGTGAYSVGGGTVRVSYWGSTSQYVDVALTGWRVVGGRPAVGSQATIAGATGTITARVTASSAGSVVYLVTVTSGGTSASYTVTATYPASGIPTYTAVRN